MGTEKPKFELFRQFSGKFALFWVILPNICAIAMWPVGGPSAAHGIFASGLLAILFCTVDRVWVRRVGLAICFALSTLLFIASSFNLELTKALSSLVYLSELNIGTSPEYVAAALLIVVALLAGLKFGAHVPRLALPGQKLMALAPIALLVNVDMVATAGTRGSYKSSAPADAPIDSAVLRNQISPKQIAARHLVVIMVESLGTPNNDYDRALYEKAWGNGRWSGRYDVSSGTTTYYGSTTNAELRELCAVWSDYQSYAFGKPDCLPWQFRKAGFDTTAIHSFSGSFFDRQTWYPKLGFERRIFEPELLAMGAAKCGGVFGGVCDTDIPHLIGDRLRQAGSKRQLVYWLTLNSHLPVAADESLHTQTCSTGDAQWDAKRPMLCRVYAIHQKLADAVAAEVMRPDFPDADILIVGDHMPPFFQRDMRTRYDDRHVPWIMLRRHHQTAAPRS